MNRTELTELTKKTLMKMRYFTQTQAEYPQITQITQIQRERDSFAASQSVLNLRNLWMFIAVRSSAAFEKFVPATRGTAGNLPDR